MTGEVEISVADRVQTLRLSRPAKKNALTSAMYEALASAFERGDATDDVAVHVIMGSDGVFSAGNDIGEFLGLAERGADPMREVLRFVRLLPRIKKPVIAGVEGVAAGIGATLLFHCDLVFATPEARFSAPFLSLGLVPEAASSLLMPARMGYARAFEMLVLGAVFPSERMREAGLVNAIVPGDMLDRTVRDAALALAAKPPEALRIARQLMRGDTEGILARTDAEAAAFRERLASPEAREAFQAFLEKRPPDFTKARASG